MRRLSVAAINIETYKLSERVRLLAGDLFEPVVRAGRDGL